MKKFFALILAVLMAMSLFATAAAEDWDEEAYPGTRRNRRTVL